MEEEFLAVGEEVDVGVAEAGDDGFAGEIEAGDLRRSQRRDFGVGADGGDAAVSDEHGAGARLGGVESDEVGVGEEDFVHERESNSN